MIFQRNKNKKYLIIDVGSANVSLSVLELSKTNKTLRRIDTKDIGVIEDKNNTEILENSVLKSVKSMLEKFNPKNLEGIHLFLSAPWHLCVYNTLKFNLNGKIILTEQKIKDLVDVENKSVAPSGKELIFRESISFTFDGYKIKNIIGKKPKTLEINILEGYAPEGFVNKIKSFLEIFQTRNIYFHSFSTPSFSLISNRFKKDKFISIDFAGEVMEISVVEGGFLKENKSVPVGFNDIYRLISKELKVDISSSRSIFDLYLKSGVDDKTKEVIDIVIKDKFKNIVHNKIRNHIFKDSIGSRFFKNIFIYTDRKYKDLIKDIFSEYLTRETILSNLDIRISVVRGSMFDNLIKHTDSGDVFSLCEAYYVDSLHR